MKQRDVSTTRSVEKIRRPGPPRLLQSRNQWGTWAKKRQAGRRRTG